jgi:hypothetical protein
VLGNMTAETAAAEAVRLLEAAAASGDVDGKWTLGHMLMEVRDC